MKNLDRLSKLEARFRPKPVRYAPGILVQYVDTNGDSVESTCIKQLSNSWPLTVEREWMRCAGEPMQTFAARVSEQAPLGALLICSI